MKTPLERTETAKLTGTDLGLRNPIKFTDHVLTKLDALDPNDFTEGRLLRKARTLTGMVRDSGEGRYTALPMLTYTEAIVALLELIQVDDEVRDTYAGGLDDDLRRLTEVCTKHRTEIERFLAWRRTTS